MAQRCATWTMPGSSRVPTATATAKGPDGTLVLDASGAALALGADLCERLYVVVL